MTMRVAEWKRMVRPILPPGEWAFRGSLVYRRPVGRVLFGALGEGSGFDRGSYVYRLVMPLVVPSTVVTLTWSHRIGGGSRKFQMGESDALVGAVATALSDPPTDEMSLRGIVARGTPLGANRLMNEMVGYAQVLLGDLEAANKSLASVTGGPSTTEWQEAAVDRARLIAELIASRGRSGATAQLDKWRDATVGALGIR